MTDLSHKGACENTLANKRNRSKTMLGTLLEKIHKELKDFRDNVLDYYGINLDDYQKPEIFKTPDIQTIIDLGNQIVSSQRIQEENQYAAILYPADQGGITQLTW